jgi:type IV pilus assembly protein PilC
MKSYSYIARDSVGSRKKGLTQAISSSDVLDWLRGQGFTPISIDEITVGNSTTRRAARRKRVKSADLGAFCWQLTTMLEGGIPVTTAIDTISEDTDNLQLQQVLQQISDKVKKGQPFSECAAEFPKIFNKLSCAILLAGETGGNLADVLRKLAEYFDNRDKLAKKIKGAVAYPIFVMSFIILIVTAIMAFIVPKFRMMFEQLGGDLPAFTQGFMWVYDLICQNLIYIIGLIFILIIVSVILNKTSKGHYWFSKMFLGMPLFGKVLKRSFIAMFCRTMSTLLTAGVSVLEVFDILSGMTGNDIIKSAIVQTREHILAGSNISLSMAATGFFPNMVVKMIQVGEESGSLPIVLERTSDHYERKVDSIITTMTSLLEPIMIITVGAIVSIVVIALYLPIFTMSEISG